MTAPARLTGLRLLGFKSFAERTTVEFGAGISAIVGPNGSGKSNLADALRWTLGEAGRSLRTRRAEDVIFAGSSARRATSMADVTLLLDNSDRLLPVDFTQVELGRRLYRSGENEYLLNRQRVRLRDLIELLDAGNLADNAFLFIGQGMVDQALALRPEERRPLFEEAAGVRRHERRRRQAETELAEAETNLERLRDVLAELRPQARRLAAQAEQLLARRSAGHELAEALVTAAQARWTTLSAVGEREQVALAGAHAEADLALAELRAAEDEGQRISRLLAERGDSERAQRTLLDQQRAGTVELRLGDSRVKSEQAALARDRQRIAGERNAMDARAAKARAALDGVAPSVEPGLADQIAAIDAELEELRGSGDADARDQSDRLASERAILERREAAFRRQIDDLAQKLIETDAAVAAAESGRDEAAQRAAEARRAFGLAENLDRVAHAAHDAALAEERRVRNEHAELEATLAGLRLRLPALQDELDRASTRSLARAVRAHGGSLAAEGLRIDPQFRAAVTAALGEAVHGWLVDGSIAAALPREGGSLVLRSPPVQDSAVEAQAALAGSVGGWRLVDAVRRDPEGAVTRLLSRTLWVPRLEDALRIRDRIAAGWQVVTTEGQLVSDAGVVLLGAGGRFLSLRADQEALAERIGELEAWVEQADEGRRAAGDASAHVALALKSARARLDDARSDMSVAEEVERTAQRRADIVLRDQAWQRARLAGVSADAKVVGRELAELPEVAARPATPRAAVKRRAELDSKRDELSRDLAAEEARERAAVDSVRRAEVTIAIDQARAAELDAEAERLAEREAELAGEDQRLTADLVAAERAEGVLATMLDRIAGDASHDRALLIATETRAAGARERLRVAEARSRSAEVAAMEAVLQLDAQREQLLVELAGIGPDALEALTGSPDSGESEVASAVSSGLDAAAARWQKGATAKVDPPSAGKLASLRRRFHELGAGNPFAAAEYAEARDRLETMEAQASDLESAIGSTRLLIGDLNTLIATQFRSTFTALEGAFARRFEQLFDGGEAQLALTTPDDLSATGIEITARPPGKKRQPLQMLSGGERALTAVALLLAMLEVRPVPFCVLDEVDAALDEANIARFAQAVRSLADQTQFIVITHNRGTIESADALYGVTIGADAVSRVISMRLPPVPSNGAAQHETAAEVLA